MRNFSTCEDVMEQINSKQKLLGKEHISAILPTEPTARRSMKSFHHRSTSVQNHNPLDPYGYAREIVGHVLQVSREDTADILQMANGVDNLFMQQRTVPTTQKGTKEVYDTSGCIDNHFKKKKLYSEEKDEYGVYRDDQGYARDVDGHIINVSKEDIRKLIERALRDEHNYICLPEHASSFTQTKLVQEIYTKDEINEMFYGVCGAQENWLNTCMEEMRQDIAKIQHGTDKHEPASIDRHHPTSIDDGPKNSHPMKSQPDFHTRAEIDQLVEEIYGTLETTKKRLDRRCDDIYFPMDLSISALTSKIEAIQGELVSGNSELHCPSTRSIRNNKSTDIPRQKLVDDPTNRVRLVPKVTSDMSDTQPEERRSQLAVGVKIGHDGINA
ncbi:hypothetical protein F2Q69_00047790 [Brassica cretica]|uniref:Uncharacterized protein n=1 Tax=Brassica cretica TaxID=69181 RepID=A0A8S9PV26_BRACR|nr:hypothetical protein F2Q69_00047790 [Brassica cretica]